jgi:hypothetical protein
MEATVSAPLQGLRMETGWVSLTQAAGLGCVRSPLWGSRWAFPSMTNPRSILKTNWPWLPPGHTTSGAVRMGECNHEMPGLPYPAFRRVNAERGDGPSVDGSPYALRNSFTSERSSTWQRTHNRFY